MQLPRLVIVPASLGVGGFSERDSRLGLAVRYSVGRKDLTPPPAFYLQTPYQLPDSVHIARLTGRRLLGCRRCA
ncbi:Uncharacterised protein [Mycobacteroides abscessus]|nr:Uncharacterised protein [Mycobacteroides abscessus]